ncbi:uncharacterized protein G2W53_016316 [Senna tora]|uniref:Uncharacterized protein n=1 Tax=Senna tora TaxID=362788 RepID=A0A834TP48_9FABA|nr:uncharacterized protein G2W53_016316 [Senna tora]
MDSWSGGSCSIRRLRVPCILDGARYLKELVGLNLVQGMMQRGGFLSEEEECIVSSVFSGGVGESEYILASESSSSVALSSSDTWIGDDGGRRLLLKCSFTRSFTEVVIDKDNFSISCNNSDEGPIRAHHIRKISKFEGSLDVPALGSLVEYLLKFPSFRPVHVRRFFIVRSIFSPRSIDFLTSSPSRYEKERFA